MDEREVIMPSSSPRACSRSGCSALSCSEDNCLAKRQDTHKTKGVPAGVLGPSKIYHSVRWRKLRRAFMSKHPLCVRCLHYGLVVTATDLDHVIAVAANKSLQWNTSNMQPLCKSCHSHKTTKEQAGVILDYRKYLNG